MPLRRFTETPPAATPPGESPASPPAAPPAALEDPPPSPIQLQAAARELAQAAERTDRSAREILARALVLTESLARSLDRTERRTAADALWLLLSAALLCAVTAVLSTLVTLTVLVPHSSVLDLLRLLWRRG
jgi:hypothetical protein